MDITDATKTGLIGIAAGLVATGVAIGPAGAEEQQAWASRTDGKSFVLDDDADEDDFTDDPDLTDTGLDTSDDVTGSQVTAVSMDTDISVAGLTRDLTKDGPGPAVRDWSANATNDASVADTRASRATNDATRSNFTAISRDRDLSRADLTRDLTRDGGDLTRDLTRNLTNDASRNDTR